MGNPAEQSHKFNPSLNPNPSCSVFPNPS